MNFEDGSAFLELAKELVKQATRLPNQEAKLRTAISRAYYAAFLKARYHLRYKEHDRNIPRNVDVHKYVREKFKASEIAERKEIAQGLENLREERNKADYDPNYRDLSRNSQLVLLSANNVISLLETL
jgi:uncharacterized protein (UPF0332 family)